MTPQQQVCDPLAAVAGFVRGGYPRAAVGSVGRIRRLLGSRIVPGGSCFAVSEVIFRAGPFARTVSPSGTLVQIPGPVCCHSTTLFGSIMDEYEQRPSQVHGVFTPAPVASSIESIVPGDPERAPGPQGFVGNQG